MSKVIERPHAADRGHDTLSEHQEVIPPVAFGWLRDRKV
jgi:hypothetical protein